MTFLLFLLCPSLHNTTSALMPSHSQSKRRGRHYNMLPPSASRYKLKWLIDEESKLQDLQKRYSKATWNNLQVLYNGKVPATRSRTVDSLCRKWRRMHQVQPANTAVKFPLSDQHISIEPMETLPQDLNMNLSVCTYHHQRLNLANSWTRKHRGTQLNQVWNWISWLVVESQVLSRISG